MTSNVAIQVGSYVFVDFISASRTEFSGAQFSGDGVVDAFDDLYVMGRLNTGLPFMCGYDDITVIELAPEKPAESENTLSMSQVKEYVENANSEELEAISSAVDERFFNFGVISYNDKCTHDLLAEAEEARKLTIIDFIERINLVGLHDALEELRRDGFMLGVRVDPLKLEL